MCLPRSATGRRGEEGCFARPKPAKELEYSSFDRTGGIGGGRVHGERKAWAQRRNEEMEWRRGILARMRKSSSLEHNTKGKVKGA